MTEYCEQHAFDAWFETSAKENINIEEAARFLIARVRASFLHMVYVLDCDRHFVHNMFSVLGKVVDFFVANNRRNVPA